MCKCAYFHLPLWNRFSWVLVFSLSGLRQGHPDVQVTLCELLELWDFSSARLEKQDPGTSCPRTHKNLCQLLSWIRASVLTTLISTVKKNVGFLVIYNTNQPSGENLLATCIHIFFVLSFSIELLFRKPSWRKTFTPLQNGGINPVHSSAEMKLSFHKAEYSVPTAIMKKISLTSLVKVLINNSGIKKNNL